MQHQAVLRRPAGDAFMAKHKLIAKAMTAPEYVYLYGYLRYDLNGRLVDDFHLFPCEPDTRDRAGLGYGIISGVGIQDDGVRVKVAPLPSVWKSMH